MALKPFLFIGVGGTGGKTLGVIRDQLATELAAIGLQKLPRAWQFLHIDVPADPDSATEDLAYELSRTEYVGLTSNSSTFANVTHNIDASLLAEGRERYMAWDSWRPYHPADVRVQISKGAGQFRGVGRVASQFALQKIAASIDGALERIRNTATAGELRDLQRARGVAHIDMAEPAPVVYVVGSIGGGSGSGMLLDVCEVIRAQGVESVTAIVFTPEVFAKPNGTFDAGVAPNTFAAINELSNAMWSGSQRGESTRDTLFARAGIARASGFGGPSGVFLVGRSSGKISLSGPNEVYAVVGHSLASVALDEDLSNDLVAYVETNAQSRTTGKPDYLGLSAPASRDYGLYSALGFGRMSLGRDYFDRYASERLIRLAAERLLDNHLTLHYPGDGKTDDQVLEEATTLAWPHFLGRIPVNERTQQFNQVVEALDPEREVGRLAGDFVSRVAADIASASQGGRILHVQARITASATVREFTDSPLGFLAESRREMAKKAPRWARDVRSHLADAVVAAAAEHGLPVARRLIEKLISYTTESVTELREVDRRRAMDAIRHANEMLETVPDGADKRIRVTDEVAIGEITGAGVEVLKAAVKKQTYELVASVLEDLIGGLLRPWSTALKDADALLRDQARPYSRRSPLTRMPGDSGVPDHLRPSKVEYLLDDVEAFPATFEARIAASAGDGIDLTADDGWLDAVHTVVVQIIRGERLRVSDSPASLAVRKPASYAQHWVPELGADRAPSRAIIETAFGIPSLRERVFEWLHDDRKDIGRYLVETFTDYLTPPSEAEQRRREDRFVNQFAAALGVAAPLVTIDPTLLQAVHGQDTPDPWARMSPIGVPSHLTELRSRVADAVATLVGPVVEPSFTTNPSTDVTILTSYDAPYHPLEFTSIMEPITRQWLAQRDNPDFWLYRRTAPLTEWVPLSPTSRASLIRGWFASRVLGRASFVVTPEGGRFEVFVPDGTGGRWETIEARAIRRASADDQIANLVEAVPFAMLEAFRAKSLRPLVAFQTLIQLGAGVGTVTDAVRAWVSTGQGVADASRAYKLAGPSRAEALLAQLDRLIGTYEGLSDPATAFADPAVAQNEPRHEVHTELVAALTALKASAVVVVQPENDDR